MASRRWKFGPPELVGVALTVLAATVPAAVIMLHRPIEWRTTTGEIVSADFRVTHYNAPSYRSKVDVAYTYKVGGVPYSGRWTGFWPDADSPNALDPGRAARRLKPGYPLRVHYNAADPTRSRLHERPGPFTSGYGFVAVVLVCLTIGYWALIYPAWKRRR